MSLPLACRVVRRPLRTTSHLLRPSPPASRRYAGSKDLADPASDVNQDSKLSNQQPGTEVLPEHHFDVDHVDQGTSSVAGPTRTCACPRTTKRLTASRSFSPVPKRVMDGSEPGETLAAAVLSGAPIDLQARTVRIYKPAKTATQSGSWHSHHWRMDWDVLSKGHRWENPLMGWQSSADAMQGTHLNFSSREDAIRFAHKQGYEYFVQEPNERKFVPKAYANNFLHSPGKLKHIRTK